MAAKPFIRDPSGLLNRVPELEEIAEEDPRVLAAIASGDPHAVYSALRLGRLLGRIRQHAATAKELLANRRLFLVPSRGRLWLSTYNGIGMTFYGQGEPDLVDGSYIATHYLVAFFVPIFPLGQYLVRQATAQGGKGFFVLGRMPFNLALRLWSFLVTLLIFAGFMATLLSLLRSAQHNDFYVINEIGVPIEARIAGQAIQVATGSHEKADLPTGNHEIKIFGPKAQLLETGRVRIRPGQKIIAWNVLGAAALVQRSIEYRQTVGKPPAPEPPHVHCGDRVVVYRNVDYAFTDPPKWLRTSGSGETRTHLFVAEPGISACLRYLDEQARTADLVAIFAGHAQAMSYAGPVLEEAVDRLLRLSAADKALILAREGRAQNPTSLQHHRIYQDAMVAAGQRMQASAEYAEGGLTLGEADLAYLKARLLTQAEARLAQARELPKKYPDHASILAWAANALCGAGDFAAAATLHERLHHLDGARYVGDSSDVAMALVATGRAPAALDMLREAFESDLGENHQSTQITLAALYVSIATKVGSDPELLLRRLAGERPDELRPFVKLLAGLPPPSNSKLPDGLMTIWNAQESVILRAEAIAGLEPRVLRELPGYTLLLGFAEAVRQGSSNLAALRQAAERQFTRHSVAMTERYVQQGGALEMYDAPARAVLLFVRSRVTSLPAAERQALRSEAERLAVIPSVLTRAMAAWTTNDLTMKPEKTP